MQRNIKINFQLPPQVDAIPVLGQFNSFISMSQKVMEGKEKRNNLNIFWKERLSKEEKRKFLIFLATLQDHIDKIVNPEKEHKVLHESGGTEDEISGPYKEIIDLFRVSARAKLPHQTGF